MARIPLPAHCVVLIVGGKQAAFGQAAAEVPQSAVAPWDVQKPALSLERLHDALGDSRLVRVCMPNSNAKARKAVAAAAHRRGARCICLRLPGSPEVDATSEKIDASYDIADPALLEFELIPMPSDRTHLTGPFDIIGDVHGCADELLDLLSLLGHLDEGGRPRPHPGGRIAILLGDLTDRGPQNRRVLEVARSLSDVGGLVLRGNHDEKLRRWLLGKTIQMKSGLDVTVQELSDTSEDWRQEMAGWISTLEPHLMLDGGRLAVAHAGIDEEHQGRHTSGATSFALYGKPVAGGTEVDEEGYPLREDWARTYAGAATVVHGHVVYDEPRIVGNVVSIDTGCVHGGRLTAYRWPEKTFVSVPARAQYCVKHLTTPIA
ncbi:metallophosphoesterase [Sphingomonas sp. 3-13AW]|uniref:metallophosphoesterase n=1 Tax=Sphingomonas sp. 3-13AW TaxID=3050450 RepID=UPI003BB57705